MQDIPKKNGHTPPPPNRRGRPYTGTALTDAERKALQRERDRIERSVSEMTLEAVLSGAGGAVRAGDLTGLAVLTTELTRRAKKITKT